MNIIHHYYSSAKYWNIISVLNLNVLTFQHTILVKTLFPPNQYPEIYTLYFHFIDIHIPVINRMFLLLNLTSEIEGLPFFPYFIFFLISLLESSWRDEKLILKNSKSSIGLVVNMLLVRSYFKEKHCHSFNSIPHVSSERKFENIQISNRFTKLPKFKFFL